MVGWGKRLWGVGAIAMGLMAGTAQAAVSCSVNTSGLPLANYNPIETLSVSANTMVRVACSGSPEGDTPGGTVASIVLSPGTSNDALDRTLRQGAETLHYNVYKDASWTEVLGDGNNGTQTLSACLYGSNCNNPNGTYQAPLYGAVPPHQDVAPGAYQDTLVLQVVY